MEIKIRKMLKEDIVNFNREFKLQGWDKPIALFERYYKEQESGTRKIFVACIGEQALGYATLISNDCHGPFANMNIPTVCDFNVLEKYQKKRSRN